MGEVTSSVEGSETIANIFPQWQELVSLSCSANTSSMLGESMYQ